MKRRTWILVISLLSVLMVYITAQFISSLTNSQLATELPTEPSADPEVFVEPANFVCFADYSEYQEFVQTEDALPDNFISADMITSLGTFSLFSCQTGADILAYAYKLTLGNGENIWVRVLHGGPYRLSTDIVISPDKIGTDMFTLTSAETGYIQRDCVRYVYLNGKLIAIHWWAENNDVEFRVSIPSDWLKNTPLPADHLLTRLITAPESVQVAAARDAVNEFVTHLTDNGHMTE